MKRLVRTTAVLGVTVALLGSGCGGDDGGGGGGSESAFCDELLRLTDSGVLSDEETSFTDAAALEEGMTEAREALDALASDVPSEIKDDFNTVKDGLTGFIDLLEEYDFDFVALATAAQEDPELLARVEAFGSEEFTQAGENLDAYGADVCGIESDTTAG